MLATLIAYLYVLSFVKIKYKFVIVKYFCGEHSAKNTTVNSHCVWKNPSGKTTRQGTLHYTEDLMKYKCKLKYRESK